MLGFRFNKYCMRFFDVVKLLNVRQPHKLQRPYVVQLKFFWMTSVIVDIQTIQATGLAVSGFACVGMLLLYQLTTLVFDTKTSWAAEQKLFFCKGRLTCHHWLLTPSGGRAGDIICGEPCVGSAHRCNSFRTQHATTHQIDLSIKSALTSWNLKKIKIKVI